MSNRPLARIAPLMLLVALVALAVGGAPSAQGASFIVDATHDAVDASPGDGVCADAGGACTLRAAVMETNALAGADEISLPAGTYVLSIPGGGEDAAATGDLDITDELAITAPVIVNGAPEPSATVDGARLDRVFHVLPAASAGILGIVVQNGSANIGGGIHNEGVLSIGNGAVRNNVAAAPLGCPGICPAPEGGGIANLGDFDAEEIAIIDNLAFVGGGIVNDGSISLNRGSLAGNTATSEGGAISNFGNVSITETSISRNTAGSTGGAIDNNAGDLTVRDSTFDSNEADYGGAVYNQAASVIANVTISGNLAARQGGGFLNISSKVTATNVTVADNDSPKGGGIYNGSVDGLGGPGLVSLVNTIVALSPNGGDCSGPITSLGHNLDSDGTCGLNAVGDASGLGQDAGVLPLADNGGPTQTHALQQGGCQGDACVFGSPAIDNGDPASCPSADQRGIRRPQDGNGDGNAVCDIGAYEHQFEPLPTSFPPPPPTATPSLAPTPSVTPAVLPASGGEAGSAPGAMRLALPVVAAIAVVVVVGGAVWPARRRRR